MITNLFKCSGVGSKSDHHNEVFSTKVPYVVLFVERFKISKVIVLWIEIDNLNKKLITKTNIYSRKRFSYKRNYEYHVVLHTRDPKKLISYLTTKLIILKINK